MSILDNVHPLLIEKVNRILRAMSELGFPMKVTDGIRTEIRQAELYAQGRTTPGKIVTEKDGFILRSNHQIKMDGFGHAVDCCFQGMDPYLEHSPNKIILWCAYGSCAEALELNWGGRWKQFVDKPHVELG